MKRESLLLRAKLAQTPALRLESPMTCPKERMMRKWLRRKPATMGFSRWAQGLRESFSTRFTKFIRSKTSKGYAESFKRSLTRLSTPLSRPSMILACSSLSRRVSHKMEWVLLRTKANKVTQAYSNHLNSYLEISMTTSTVLNCKTRWIKVWRAKMAAVVLQALAYLIILTFVSSSPKDCSL